MPETLNFASLGLAPGEIAFCLAVVAAAGFMRGFAGFGFAVAAMPGPPVTVLFLAGPLTVEVGRASMVVAFFAFSNAVGAAAAGVAGLLGWGTALLALASVPLLLGAQWAGRRAYARGGEGQFRRIASWFLAALALLTAARAGAALY